MGTKTHHPLDSPIYLSLFSIIFIYYCFISYYKTLFNLGQTWKQMRATLSPAFSGSKMRLMFVLMSDCAEEFVNNLGKEVKDKEVLTLEMKDVFSRYTNDVIATCAFGVTCNSLKEKNNEFFLNGKELTEFTPFKTMKFFGYTISPTIMKVLSLRIFNDNVTNFFRDIITSAIKLREEKKLYRPDMIHLFMEARKGNLKHDGNFVQKDTGFATVDESEMEKKGENKKKGNFSICYF